MNTFQVGKTYASLIAATMIGGGAFAADAPQAPRLVDHNGSTMQIVLLPDDSIDIVYVRLRPGLWGYAAPGTVFVHGQWRQGVLYATAYAPSRCDHVPYKVSGTTDASGVLVLTGPAPLLDPLTCQIIQWIWSANSVLAFVPPGPAR
jgi:hypothetical protein